MAEHGDQHDKDDGGHAPSHHGAAQAHGGGHEEAHEGAPEWLISFADNVTLMMGFFVILLAISMAEKASGAGTGSGSGEPTDKMIDTTIAIREAFNNPVDINSMNPNEWRLVRRLLQRGHPGYSLQPGLVGDDHNVESIRPSHYAKSCAVVAFRLGSTTLSDEAKKTIAAAADAFRGVRLILEIRGHASAEEAHKSTVAAMKLSYDRAMTVAGFMAEAGIDWRQLRIVSCADNDRVNPIAYDESGQKENARVEIFPTNELMPSYIRKQTSVPTTQNAEPPSSPMEHNKS